MLAARVFAEKFKEFKKDVVNRGIFGKVTAWTYSIEVQKR